MNQTKSNQVEQIGPMGIHPTKQDHGLTWDFGNVTDSHQLIPFGLCSLQTLKTISSFDKDIYNFVQVHDISGLTLFLFDNEFYFSKGVMFSIAHFM